MDVGGPEMAPHTPQTFVAPGGAGVPSGVRARMAPRL
jgi:hypothetical protein